MESETQYEARAIRTEGDVEGDMPRRLAAGPMHLIVYVREDVVAEIRTRLAACEGALRLGVKQLEEATSALHMDRADYPRVYTAMDAMNAALKEPSRGN